MSTQPDSTPAATAEAPDKGVGCDALLAVWMVYDNQFGNVDSIWRDEAGANAAEQKANKQSKEIYDGRYFYIVRKEPLMSSANGAYQPRPSNSSRLSP